MMTNRLNMAAALVAALLTLSGCGGSYRITGIERSRIMTDARYDGSGDNELKTLMAPYKQKIDSMMSPVTGRAARYMSAERPESTLSNLLADIMIWAGKDYNEQPEFAVYNIGGIRAAIAEGDITYGDVLDVAPFENKICFVTLTGDKVLELFRQIASVGGEGVSHGVELEITADGKLASSRLNGSEIVPERKYRIATIDYLAQGNDKMLAFKNSTDINSPQTEENNTRFIIMRYMKERMDRGLATDAAVEGRIRIVK